MATDVEVPALGESITEGTLAEWLKQPGEAVAADEPIASLETDKVSVEVPSPVAGVLTEQLVQEAVVTVPRRLIVRRLYGSSGQGGVLPVACGEVLGGTVTGGSGRVPTRPRGRSIGYGIVQNRPIARGQ